MMRTSVLNLFTIRAGYICKERGKNMDNRKKFDGYKFHQALKATTPVTGTYGSDWELHKEMRLQAATNDTARMWRHLWQKLTQRVGANKC